MSDAEFTPILESVIHLVGERMRSLCSDHPDREGYREYVRRIARDGIAPADAGGPPPLDVEAALAAAREAAAGIVPPADPPRRGCCQ